VEPLGGGLAWVVACRSVEEAYAYRFLSDLKELP